MQVVGVAEAEEVAEVAEVAEVIDNITIVKDEEGATPAGRNLEDCGTEAARWLGWLVTRHSLRPSENNKNNVRRPSVQCGMLVAR